MEIVDVTRRDLEGFWDNCSTSPHDVSVTRVTIRYAVRLADNGH